MQKNDNSIIKINFLDAFVLIKRIEAIDMSALTEKETEKLHSISHIAKKKEFSSVRQLRNIYFPLEEITYLPSGKPIFENRKEKLSISHSKNFAGIAISTFEIGLDIEEIEERVLKIVDRFLNSNEKLLFENTAKEITIAWTIKEALFKRNNRSGIIFKEELLIEKRIDENIYQCKILNDSGWEIVYVRSEQIENLIISFTFVPDGVDFI